LEIQKLKQARQRRFNPAFYCPILGELQNLSTSAPKYYAGGNFENMLDSPRHHPVVALYWAIMASAINDLAARLNDTSVCAYRQRERVRRGEAAQEWVLGKFDSTVTIDDACDAIGIDISRVIGALRRHGLIFGEQDS
jgi:hypothetical protein